MLSFEEYLVQKNIDGPRFKEAEPDVCGEWEELFYHLHPASFTAQKKFLINEIRRKYLLKKPEVNRAPD